MALPLDTRIGFLAPITWQIPPDGYGPWEKVVTNITRGLVSRGYNNVTIIATNEARIPGAKTVAVIERPLGEPPPDDVLEINNQHIEFAYQYAKESLDIIHNHFNFQPLDLLSKLNIPVVTTLHGSGIEPAAKEGYSKHRNMAFVSISNAERQFVPELNYVATVYNGIDFNEFPFEPSPEKYLANIGRIHPTKGVHHAVELARRLDWPLKIAGLVAPDQEIYFDQKIKPFLSEKIEYLGSLSSADVSLLVRKATALTGLIDWEEPFGLSVAEAMASGTPVIGTPRGSHKEIIKDSITGVLATDVDEAVRRFPEIALINRQHCRDIAKTLFSLETMTAGYLDIYEKLLVGSRFDEPGTPLVK